jgi:hypothetical protein
MGNSKLHANPDVQAVLEHCPFLTSRVDLKEHSYYIFGEIALMIRDGGLSDSEMRALFAHFERMATSYGEPQNLLVVGVLESLTDTPESIERARTWLGAGPARLLFERVLKGYSFPSPNRK